MIVLPPTGRLLWWKGQTKVEAASNAQTGSNRKAVTEAFKPKKEEVLYKIEPLHLTHPSENQVANPSSDLEHADRKFTDAGTLINSLYIAHAYHHQGGPFSAEKRDHRRLSRTLWPQRLKKPNNALCSIMYALHLIDHCDQRCSDELYISFLLLAEPLDRATHRKESNSLTRGITESSSTSTPSRAGTATSWREDTPRPNLVSAEGDPI